MKQRYARSRTSTSQLGRKRTLFVIAALLLAAAIGLAVYATLFKGTPAERAANRLQFDPSVTEAEQAAIRQAVAEQAKTYDGTVNVRVETAPAAANVATVVAVFVPVASAYDARQSVTSADLVSLQLFVPADTDDVTREALAAALGVPAASLQSLAAGSEVPNGSIAFVPPSQLSPTVKLLAFEGGYYLDSFTSGALFRQAVFEGGGTAGLNGLSLNTNPSKETTFKVNMTGVTALTRVMIRKLASVPDATYFSQKIGDFLADADLTHVSNEVSFKEGCTYHAALFCSPPGMIDALKDSGVDVVELTGNHNNDVGSQANTQTINLYHSLGWGTFGGGLNAVEAAKPFVAEQKGTKVAFLGYNQADAPGSGALATATGAGANPFSATQAQADISAAKEQGSFVVVDVQYSECFAYPGGYTEMPSCDQPISGQTAAFRRYIDMGADVVIGSSAHQPQTYELYKDKPIYYGLGNMYFDQTQQPGTERGIILTHYFVGGKLLQTKLTPTVYDKNLQTQLMDGDDAQYLLERLQTARAAAGL
ncbi:MAG: CapA family protein [Candidatus Saccharimonadales bacterium]